MAQSSNPDPKKIDVNALHPGTVKILKKLGEVHEKRKSGKQSKDVRGIEFRNLNGYYRLSSMTKPDKDKHNIVGLKILFTAKEYNIQRHTFIVDYTKI